MITRIVVTLILAMIVCFAFQKQLMEVLRKPVEEVWVGSLERQLPDAKKDDKLTSLTVDQWEEAKRVDQVVRGLDAEQRVAYFKSLDDPELAFHARSVSLLRAASVLPEDRRDAFLRSLEVDEAMRLQVLALLVDSPSPEVDQRGNLRLMSALKPTETFMLSMKLSFFAGIVLSFPLLLLFVLQFVVPGLHQHEKKVIWPALVIGFGLFLGGVAFAYFVVLPRALTFFFEWSGNLGVSNDWRIGEYVTFATQFTLLFGLSFELPVVVMVLVKLGLLSYETMSKTRNYAIVAIFIIAAIITPTPDIMTLTLMATPMIILYEICIWLAWFSRRKEIREEQEMEKRRLEWLLSHDEPAVADEPPAPDPYHDAHHDHHDDGWHEDYEPAQSHGLPGDEEWVQPEEDHPIDDIPEEEKRRMHDYGTDKDEKD